MWYAAKNARVSDKKSKRQDKFRMKKRKKPEYETEKRRKD